MKQDVLLKELTDQFGGSADIPIKERQIALIIGKGGATIREIEARSKAKVSVAEGKGGPGMATLVVVGDERAGESVRMMANNALGGGKR